MSRDIHPFGLRMPEELREALRRRASLNGRSLNGEIVRLLQGVVATVDRVAEGNRGLGLSRRTNRRAAANVVPSEEEWIALLRGLPDEKQRALLTLLR